ncbi:MAG: LecA/PA-IL family lectin [Acidobacteria bacterium]|nr:LecA/PA-IL family lectin [Acidobacteriota bacterium]
MSPTYRFVAAWTLTLALPCTSAADTLVLRDGTRVRGAVLTLRGGTIEFEEYNARGQRRVVRVNRNDVARIEFDDASLGSGAGGYGSGGDWGGGSGDWGGGGRPSGMRERTVSVSASAPWTDTGINVRPGQEIYLEATGNVRWGPDRRDGPEGENDSPYNPGRPIPNRAAAALIGRVGGDPSEVFFIGAGRGPIRMRQGGRLFLGINDDVLQDNSGSFRVVIGY